VELVPIAQIAFAVAVVVAAATLVAAAADRLPRRLLVGAAVLLGMSTVTAWIL